MSDKRPLLVPDRAFIRTAESAAVDGTFQPIEVAGVRMLLARLADGTVIAFGPTCPHQLLPLATGSIWNDTIDCPNHHYTFDARTGKNVFPANVFPRERSVKLKGIPIYPAHEEDGWVWVKPVANNPALL